MKIGKFVFEWNYPLGKPECPYAYRWRLDFYFFSFRIHKWLRSDDNRAYHNHPWHFITFPLARGYWDHRENAKPCWVQHRPRFRRKRYRHWVQILEDFNPVWTFIITFGRPRRYSFFDVKTGKRKNRDKYFIEHGHPACDEQ